jgi:hypothetical protein
MALALRRIAIWRRAIELLWRGMLIVALWPLVVLVGGSLVVGHRRAPIVGGCCLSERWGALHHVCCLRRHGGRAIWLPHDGLRGHCL